MNTKSFKFFGKNIVSVFSHHIMSLTYKPDEERSGSITMERVTDYPDKMIDGTYSKELAAKIVNKNRGNCDVFIFLDLNNEVIGTVSVMYKNGDDIEYKIRKIDAFIYNVFTSEKHRGKGYAGEMIKAIMDYLSRKSIYKVYLAVSTNNAPAIRAYEKIGFIKEYDSSFIRILKINIPYKEL